MMEVDEGIGYEIALDKIVNTSSDSNLCFRPLEPRLESGLNIIWKKHQVFSAAADMFLKAIQERFLNLIKWKRDRFYNQNKYNFINNRNKNFLVIWYSVFWQIECFVTRS